MSGVRNRGNRVLDTFLADASPNGTATLTARTNTGSVTRTGTIAEALRQQGKRSGSREE
jgi:hypothetical protein